MAKQPTTTAAKTVPGLSISSVSKTGFRRLGRAFGPEAIEIPIDEFSEADLEVLKNETQLVIRGCEIEVAAAASTDGDQK